MSGYAIVTWVDTTGYLQGSLEYVLQEAALKMFLLDILLHQADTSLSLFWSLTFSLSLIMFYGTVEAN